MLAGYGDKDILMKWTLSVTIFLIFSPQFVLAKTPLQNIVVNAENASNYSYIIKVEVPSEDEADYKRINIKFPKKLEDDFKYAYSKVLYSKDGKRMLSYRPQDISFKSSNLGEFYVVANKEIITCLSVVNIYHKQGDYGLHPPSFVANIDLGSFIKGSKKCKGALNAGNYW